METIGSVMHGKGGWAKWLGLGKVNLGACLLLSHGGYCWSSHRLQVLCQCCDCHNLPRCNFLRLSGNGSFLGATLVKDPLGRVHGIFVLCISVGQGHCVACRLFGHVDDAIALPYLGGATTNVDCRFLPFLAVESTFILAENLWICRSYFWQVQL